MLRTHVISSLSAAALLAGCSGPGLLTVAGPTTAQVMLRSEPGDGGMVSGVDIRTVGADTHLTWLRSGQKFIFRDSTGYRGEFGLESADFTVGRLDIVLTDQYIIVGSPQITLKHQLTRVIDGTLTRLFAGRVMIFYPDGRAEAIPDES